MRVRKLRQRELFDEDPPAVEPALPREALEEALRLYQRAHSLNGGDRSVCLVYGNALLNAGQAGRAVEVLSAVKGTEGDTEFRETYGVALMQAGKLDEASALFEDLYRGRTDAPEKFFDLAGRCIQAGKDDKAVQILTGLKDRMFAARKQADFLTEVERLVERCPKSLPLMEFSGQVYSELNRDSMYFGVLEKLFDLCSGHSGFDAGMTCMRIDGQHGAQRWCAVNNRNGMLPQSGLMPDDSFDAKIRNMNRSEHDGALLKKACCASGRCAFQDCWRGKAFPSTAHVGRRFQAPAMPPSAPPSATMR